MGDARDYKRADDGKFDGSGSVRARKERQAKGGKPAARGTPERAEADRRNAEREKTDEKVRDAEHRHSQARTRDMPAAQKELANAYREKAASVKADGGDATDYERRAESLEKKSDRSEKAKEFGKTNAPERAPAAAKPVPTARELSIAGMASDEAMKKYYDGKATAADHVRAAEDLERAAGDHEALEGMRAKAAFHRQLAAGASGSKLATWAKTSLGHDSKQAASKLKSQEQNKSALRTLEKRRAATTDPGIRKSLDKKINAASKGSGLATWSKGVR